MTITSVFRASLAGPGAETTIEVSGRMLARDSRRQPVDEAGRGRAPRCWLHPDPPQLVDRIESEDKDSPAKVT